MVCKGTIINIIPVKDNVHQVVLRIKKDDSYVAIAFTAFERIIVLMNQLNIKSGDTVKINYYLRSKKHENKFYFTTAVIEKIQVTAHRMPLNFVNLETGEYI